MATPPRVAVSRWEDYPDQNLESYWQRLREASLQPMDYNQPGQTLQGCAGLVLSGGIDVDPARYGARRHPRTEAPDPARDAFELGLLDEALTRDLPVLAICRGHQLLNVSFGGGLLQHIESGEHRWQARTPWASRWHEVAFAPESRLGAILEAPTALVNSRHHQAVTTQTLAPGLAAAALSSDGVVEAIECPAQRWVFGVQWHPEREEPQEPAFLPLSRRLFAAFAAAVQGGGEG